MDGGTPYSDEERVLTFGTALHWQWWLDDQISPFGEHYYRGDLDAVKTRIAALPVDT